ncbi:MAG: TonB-dependent receptor plug domain-containing protein [Bacteroidales bacterium]|nr:TonB-dependent receptor plug domain-containing protein [Bacteroidales bacterium]
MKKGTLILFVILLGVSGFSQEADSVFQSQPEIPTIILTDNDFDENESQDISGLLSSSTDVFVNTAGYTFGQARFRIRGYDNRNTFVLINGIYVNDAETGRPYYGNWGGLNDVMRNKVVTPGLLFSDYSFGGIGGVTNIITRASEQRPGTSISYSVANKSYRNRAMITHSTGLMDNGWAFTLSASSRWAQEGYVRGAFYEAYSYFVAAEKKINDKHSIGLTVMGSPSRRGKSGVGTAEIYELSGDNFYNPNWGYQNGVMRNARVGTFNQPRAMLSHYWEIDPTMKLTTSASYMAGRGGSTALNWYDAADPRPDYYRNLPSYYEGEDELKVNYLTDMWQNSETFRQLDWDMFYDGNRKNLYTVENVGGEAGVNETGNRGKYIIEDRRYDLKRFDFATLFSKELSEKSKLVAGFNQMSSETHSYKLVEDLLGADWWLDIDQFAERDFNDPYIIQSDVDNPNNIVKEGDIFGYDYLTTINKSNVFAQAEAKLSKIDFFGGFDLSYTEFWRTGNMRNGKFPAASFGNSPTHKFFNYAVKAGANVKITGRNFILLNASYRTVAPYTRDAFVSPRTRNHVVDNLTSEKIYTGDLSYFYRSPILQAKITGYYTKFEDGVDSHSFYHDELRTFVNYAMTGVDKVHYGGELGIEAKITPTISASFVTGYGKYLYDSRPLVTITQDNSSEILAENRTVYIENYHVGSMPEFAASLGGKYNAPKYWFVGVNANYFAESYINLNPEKHTAEALDIYVVDDPQISSILEQEKLDPGFTLDIWGGKSWRINEYSIGFTLSVNNILDNTDLITNGFEQYRFDQSDINKFPNKYFHLYGRSYFLNVYFRF